MIVFYRGVGVFNSERKIFAVSENQ